MTHEADARVGDDRSTSSKTRKLSGAQLPAGLLDLPEPPRELFLHGELLGGPYVGIVGTRKPTPGARAYAMELTRTLGSAGVTVVSGGAFGIDLAVHEAALSAGQPTVVVAPSSYACPYPARHAALFERVATQGAFLSEHEGLVRAMPHRFFRRNALLAGLVHALVVVEAPVRSGARNAAAWARRLNRPLFVVPTVPWNARGRGCLEELRLGARMLIAPADVLAELEKSHHQLLIARRDLSPCGPAEPAQLTLAAVYTEPAPSGSASSGSASSGSASSGSASSGSASSGSASSGSASSGSASSGSGSSQSDWLSRLVAGLRDGPRHLEELAAGCAEPLPRLQRELLMLELAGQLQRDALGRYRVVAATPPKLEPIR